MALEDFAPIDNLQEVPHTPTTQTINTAEAYDLQVRANNAERELSLTRAKVTRETRKNRQLQQQIYEYMQALDRAVQDCRMTQHHFQLVSNSHLALSQEYEKAKIMVETLETVIRMLHISSPERLGRTDEMASGEQPVADDRG